MTPDELRRIVEFLAARIKDSQAKEPAVTVVPGTVDSVSGTGPDAQIGVIVDSDLTGPVRWGQIVGGSAPSVGARVMCIEYPPSGMIVIGVSGTSGGAVTLAGDVAGPSGANVIQADAVTTAKIINDAVTNAKLADMAQATFKMRAAGSGTGDPIDGTAAQAKTALAIASTDITDFTTAAQAAITATVPITSTAGVIALQHRQKWFHAINECQDLTNDKDWLWGTAGGGAGAAQIAEANHFGIDRMTVTNAADRVNLSGRQNAFLIFGVSPWRHESMIRLTTLSDATDTLTVRSGFLDVAGANGTDGIFFRYTHSVNSGNWELVSRVAGVETITNAAVGPAAGTWTRLTIEVNAAATLATFYVDGVSAGTVATLPSGAGQASGYGVMIVKSGAGTTARTMDIDYQEILGTVFTR